MWKFRRSHRHIDPEVLTEYLDQRLSEAGRVRTELQLAVCQVCREELETLRATVALVSQLPAVAPRRSFIMAAPPPQPAVARPAPLLRMPQWAYAAAASVAVLALSALISVDATGLLAQQSQPPAASTIIGQGAPEETATLEAEAAPAAAPEGTAGPEPTQPTHEDASKQRTAAPTDAPSPATDPTPTPEQGPYVSASTPANQVHGRGAPTPEDVGSPSGGAGPTPGEAPTIEPATVPPVTIQTPQTFGASLETPEADGTQQPTMTAEPRATGPAPDGPVTAARHVDPGAGAVDSGAEVQWEGQAQGTPTFWRVLEGVAAALAVAFLVSLVLRRRLLRQGPKP